MFPAFYGLKENPFRLTPDPSFICMTMQHREALAGLIQSVCTRPGLTVLTGEAGTGKTTLLYALLDLLEKRRFVTAFCTNPTLTREEFYDFVLAKFGVECPSTLKSRQLMALQSALTRNRTDGRPSLLIIDEAQQLPMELLEEIRLLLNLETPTEKLIEIIIAGQPELMAKFHLPELRQLKQRVSYFCRLAPLTLEETREYIHHRLERAGLPRQTVFPEAIVRSIHEYTSGIPRLVNTLCSTAMQTSFALDSREITMGIVLEAAQDLDLQRSRPVLVGTPAPSPDPQAGSEIPSGVEDRDVDSPVRIPFENYASRQKSLRFFSGFMERWR